jgi:hypothetical protein
MLRLAPQRLTVVSPHRVDPTTQLRVFDGWAAPRLLAALGATLLSLTIADPIDVRVLALAPRLATLDCGGVSYAARSFLGGGSGSWFHSSSPETPPRAPETPQSPSPPPAIKIATLRSLAIRRVSRMAGVWVRAQRLEAFPALTELDIGLVRAAASLAAELVHCPRLQSLTLDGAVYGRATPRGVESVLDLFVTPPFSDTARQLDTLVLANTQKSVGLVARLLVFPALTRLSVSFCRGTDYSPLAALNKLEFLDLSDCALAWAASILPAAMPRLRVLRMPHGAWPSAMTSYPLLEELRAGCMHSAPWYAHMKGWSSACPRLRHLDIAQLSDLCERMVASLMDGVGRFDGGGGDSDAAEILPLLETLTFRGRDRKTASTLLCCRRGHRPGVSVARAPTLASSPLSASSSAQSDSQRSPPPMPPSPPGPDRVSAADICGWSAGIGIGLAVSRDPKRATTFDRAPTSNH